MSRQTVSNALDKLDALKASFGSEPAARKLELLGVLAGGQLGSASDVQRLHEVLCFMRAYPDDRAVLRQLERMLDEFARRGDLRRHRRQLENSGIAGTDTYYRFFWFTAVWLARHLPTLFHIDWQADFDKRELLESRLPLLMPYAERLALDEVALPLREWLALLKSPTETDASFLVRRFHALDADPFLKEKLYEELDIPCRIAPGDESPSRTLARYRRSPLVFQNRPLQLSRRCFHDALRRPPVAVDDLSPRRARALIRLAREAMIARQRDLDIFVHADPRDVRLLDAGDGLQFACYGSVPERRQMLDAVYGFLILKNGIPIGYFLTSSLFNSSEVAYNIFDTYRGGEAAYVYGCGLGMVRHLFAADSFAVDPYQMGHDNPEALKSGAWWFYYKLGFRPRDPAVRALVSAELRKMRSNRRHRSSIATLKRLSAVEMYLHLGRERDDIVGIFSREAVGYRLSESLALRFGAAREKAIAVCVDEARRLLGVSSREKLSGGERQAWERWAPLVGILPGVERWSRSNRAALAEVIRAKGGPRESLFVHLFDRHRPLRRAILKLAESP